MIIINATKKTQSIMTDRGDLITVEPGKQSDLVIATKNLISAAIRLGTPSEVGIVLSGSYELDVAKNISGAVPYIYTNLDEALGKLIDPTIDYKAPVAQTKLNMDLELKLTQKDEEIKTLNAEIDSLKDQLENNPSDRLIKELESKLSNLESEFKTVSTERLRLQGQLEESTDQVKILTTNLNDLRKTQGELSQDLTAVNKLSNELTEENNTLKARIKELEDSNKELSNNLAEAAQTIDDMKASFNQACEKFEIYRDDEGNWMSDKLK
jgi:methyl-accepting chemotaxis protein